MSIVIFCKIQISKDFSYIYHVIQGDSEIFFVCGRKRCRMKKAIEVVRKRIRENPVRKQKILSREMNIVL